MINGKIKLILTALNTVVDNNKIVNVDGNIRIIKDLCLKYEAYASNERFKDKLEDINIELDIKVKELLDICVDNNIKFK